MCSGLGSGAVDGSGKVAQERCRKIQGPIVINPEIVTFSAAAALPSEPLAPAVQGPPGTRCHRSLGGKERAPGGQTHWVLYCRVPGSHTLQLTFSSLQKLGGLGEQVLWWGVVSIG